MASVKLNGTPWVKCAECGEIIYNGELNRNFRTCPKCSYHFSLGPRERISLLVDKSSLIKNELDADAALLSDCRDRELYEQSIITGIARIASSNLAIAAVDLSFSDRATGVFVCANIVNIVSQAIDQRLPFLLICTNNNDSQGKERAFLPGQMLSINAAISRLLREKLLYVSVLAYSGSQGYFPGFAYVADIVIAESKMPVESRPGSQTTQNVHSQAVQTAFKNGIVDMIIPRIELRHTLTEILKFFR